MKKLLITIDGPAGAGKTTVSRMLADRLCYRYVDTGALYRGIALAAMAQKVRPDDDRRLERLLSTLRLRFVSVAETTRLFSNNTDITDNIRTSEISMLASAVSARPVVRAYLLDLQREMGQEKGVVFEGRDMGTVVFPDADVKFYLDADPHTRAKRRYDEQAETKPLNLAAIEKEIRKRDENDSRRVIAPLKPAADAVIINSTDIDAAGVVELMIDHLVKATKDYPVNKKRSLLN